MHQEVIFGLAGQSFVYDAPEGRPDAGAAVQVFLAGNDDDTGATEAATTGAVALDAVNTTLAADVAAGASELELASAASVARGRRYLLAGVEQEQCEVLAVSGTSVILRGPLLNDYSAGATFVGCRLSIGVSSSWAADKSKITDVLGAAWNTRRTRADHQWAAGAAGYRLRWTYSVAGVAQLGVGFADLVRYQAKNLVTPLDVDAVFPGWIDRLSTNNRADQGVGLVAQAFRALRFDALADEVLVRRVRDTQVLRELVIYRAMLLEIENRALAPGSQVDAGALALARDLYGQRYKQLLREPKVPEDGAGGGASAPPTKLAPWRR